MSARTCWAFAIGAASGFLLGRAGRRLPQGARAQGVFGAIGCGLLLLAWLMALRAVA
jgi:hypothetical protein